MTQARDFNFEEINYGRFRDGIDVFYKDFHNTAYPLPGAIKLVYDQVRRPAEDIEEELIEWRQLHSDRSKCINPASPKQTAPK